VQQGPVELYHPCTIVLVITFLLPQVSSLCFEVKKMEGEA
jgi:hypothetical protein